LHYQLAKNLSAKSEPSKAGPIGEEEGDCGYGALMVLRKPPERNNADFF
jgi:hypothetical protein